MRKPRFVWLCLTLLWMAVIAELGFVLWLRHEVRMVRNSMEDRPAIHYRDNGGTR